MDALEKFVAAIDARQDEFAARVDAARRVADVLHAAAHELEWPAFELFWRLQRWPGELQAELEEVRAALARYRSRYMTGLRGDQAKLQAELQELQAEVDRFVCLGDLKQVDDRMATVQDIEARLEQARNLADLYNAREEIFLLPRTEVPIIDEIAKQFSPYSDLWRICSEFARSLPEWMDGPFTEIDAEVVQADSDRWWRSSAKLSKVLAGPAGEVIGALRGKLEDFMTHLPLITAMRNPGLRDRHWDKISAACGFPVKVRPGPGRRAYQQQGMGCGHMHACMRLQAARVGRRLQRQPSACSTSGLQV